MKNFFKVLFFLNLILNLGFSDNSFAFFQDIGDSNQKKEFTVASGIGKIDGGYISVTVLVPKNESPEKIINRTLESRGATPLKSYNYLSGIEECWTIIFHRNSNPIQYYNPGNGDKVAKELIKSENLLKRSHSTWNNVKDSWIKIEYGGITNRCPSLLPECHGESMILSKHLDGYNDVAWIEIKDENDNPDHYSIAAVYFLYDEKREQWETDMFLNYYANYYGDSWWNESRTENTLLHENGHVLGLGDLYDKSEYNHCHGNVMMCDNDDQIHLGSGDIAGLLFLYSVDKKPYEDYRKCEIPCGSPVESNLMSVDPGTKIAEIKAISENACVSATANGEIRNIHFSNDKKTWKVEIKHTIDKNEKNFYWTVYDGLSEINVQVGEEVIKGYGIGQLKNDILYYSIYRNGPEDPTTYIYYHYRFDNLNCKGERESKICAMCNQQKEKGCQDLEIKCIGFSDKKEEEKDKEKDKETKITCKWYIDKCPFSLKDGCELGSVDDCGSPIPEPKTRQMCCCCKEKNETSSISDSLNYIEMMLKGLTPQNQSLSEIEVLIQELFGQIQSQVTQASQKPISSLCQGITFSRNLSMGSKGNDVKCLQTILNSNSATRLTSLGQGSPGNETDYFGQITKSAVIKFQELYASEILHPVGLTSGNGFVGPSTRNKLNQLNI